MTSSHQKEPRVPLLKGEEDYPDEAVHVAAGMLAAGFRDVIGTMWMIYDDTAPSVADIVYREVLEDGQLFVDRIPFALHHAVECLRKQRPNDFMSWMPFTSANRHKPYTRLTMVHKVA